MGKGKRKEGETAREIKEEGRGSEKKDGKKKNRTQRKSRGK